MPGGQNSKRFEHNIGPEMLASKNPKRSEHKTGLDIPRGQIPKRYENNIGPEMLE